MARFPDLPTYKWGTTHSVAYTATGAAIATTTGKRALQLRLLVTTDAYVALTGTAATTDTPMIANQPEYVDAPSGELSPSALPFSSAGSLYVTEVSPK